MMSEEPRAARTVAEEPGEARKMAEEPKAAGTIAEEPRAAITMAGERRAARMMVGEPRTASTMAVESRAAKTMAEKARTAMKTMSTVPLVERNPLSISPENTQSSAILDVDETNDPMKLMNVMNVNYLPDVLLLDIFSYLTIEDLILGARQCCQRWYFITHDAELWRHLRFNPELACRLVDGAFLNLLPEIKLCVETMVFESCYLLMDESLVHQDINCERLTGLEFSLANLSSSGLGKLVLKYQKLEHLKVRNCKFLTFVGLINALKGCRRLKSLEFDDCSCLGDARSMNKALLDVFGNMPLLKNLLMVVEELEDTTLQFVLKHCPNLETLNIASCTHITNDAFVRSGVKIPHGLKQLSLSYTGVTDCAVEFISKSCPALRDVCIKGCQYVTDIGIGSLANKCSGLQRLVVNEFNHEGSSNITNVGLAALANGCPDLRYLVINYCPGVTDIGIAAIARGCRKLQHISAAGCLSITDVALRSLAANSMQLVVAVFSECVQLTAQSINLLVGSCNRLRTLELETCHYLSQLHFGDSTLDGHNASGMPGLPVYSDSGTEINFSIVNTDPEMLTGSDSKAQRSSDNLEETQVESECQSDQILEADRDRLVGASSSCPGEMKKKQLPADSNASDATFGLVETPENEHVHEQDIGSVKTIHAKGITQAVTLLKEAGTHWTPDCQIESDDGALVARQTEPKQFPLVDILPAPRRFASLFVLKLTLCSKIANDSVKQIAKHCSDLRELSLRGCYLITDSAVEIVAEACKYLQVLDISGGSAFQTSKLTNQSLDAVGKHCKLLQKLLIQKNNRISVDGINLVAKECPKLKIIGFSVGAPSQITLEAVLMMLRRIPDQCIKCTNTPLQSRNTGAHGNLTLEIFPRPRAMSPL